MLLLYRMFGDGAAARLGAAYERTLAAHLPDGASVCIALSGGMDSCSLLDVALRFGGRWRVSACHVNHGISARAGQWERFCRELCDGLDVPLTVRRECPPADVGASEEWARAVRLAAFARLEADAVIAAHHADDQAETVLFRLLRGGGVHGIAAMDTRATPAGVEILRPWLNVERRVIAAFAAGRRLRWVEDEDNRNLSRRRNFLRWRGLPVLNQGFADSGAMLAAAGRRMREGSDLLLQLAAEDEAAARGADGGVSVAHFRALGEARIRNWLYRSLVLRRQRFSERLINEAARQIMVGSAAHGVCCRLRGVCLRRWRGALYWDGEAAAPDGFACEVPAVAGVWPMPALGGRLVLAEGRGVGLSPARTGEVLSVRLRRGGERLTPPMRRTRTVANLLQEHAVFPWRRGRLPLLYAGERLAAVAGVAVAAGFAAGEGEPGLVCGFEWDG